MNHPMKVPGQEKKGEHLTLRKMQIEDIEGILPIASTSVRTPWSKEMFLGELAHSFSYTFILYSQESSEREIPVGLICFRIIEWESELLNLCIHPQYRQKGLGRWLMKFYIDFCNRRGVKKYYLEVDPLNLPAVHLYQSFAFQEFGKRKNFYQGKHDALLMERAF